MAKKIVVEKLERSFKYCRELEEGNILFFPTIPFSFPNEEIKFLLEQKQGNSRSRKNIAYKPQMDKITNHDTRNPENVMKFKKILKNYSEQVRSFLTELLEPYAKEWILDYTSFRPFQEEGRNLRLRARNDLLHVDAFPTRPLLGKRILRFFTNINPQESRRWVTSVPFSELAKQYGGTKGVPFPKQSWINRFRKRSPYDVFMLKLHNYLKENESFQQNCVKDFWEFPPNSCWAVYTDQVSHAALFGQYALEQTFLIPLKTLLFPEKSPLRTLERLSGYNRPLA